MTADYLIAFGLFFSGVFLGLFILSVFVMWSDNK